MNLSEINNGFINIKNYLATIPKPKTNSTKDGLYLQLHDNTLKYVRDLSSNDYTLDYTVKDTRGESLSESSSSFSIEVSESDSDLSLQQILNDHGDSDVEDNGPNLCLPSIKLENYYVVYYDNTWYIGRILSKEPHDNYKIKFLHENLEKFDWPKHNDIQIVNSKFIIHGPITLKGFGPFEITRIDRMSIKNQYKNFKKRCLSK